MFAETNKRCPCGGKIVEAYDEGVFQIDMCEECGR
jgi:hypothetical protein